MYPAGIVLDDCLPLVLALMAFEPVEVDGVLTYVVSSWYAGRNIEKCLRGTGGFGAWVFGGGFAPSLSVDARGRLLRPTTCLVSLPRT